MSIAPIQAVTIECVEDEERAFRRIGRAVVFLWQEIHKYGDMIPILPLS